MTKRSVVAIDADVVDHADLHPLAGWLYVVIVRHINRENNDAFPSVGTLAKLANMSKASVIRYTKELEEKKLITVTREKESIVQSANHYQLMKPSVVADSNQYGVSQQPLVSHSNHENTQEPPAMVSHSNPNHKDINKHQDINKNTKRAREVSDLDDVPKQDRLEICKAWADNLPISPIGAYSDKNQHTAAEIFRAGYRATQVAMYVKAKMADPWWIGKNMTLGNVADYMPQWLLDTTKPRRIVPEGVINAGQNIVPYEWGVNEFAHQPLDPKAVSRG